VDLAREERRGYWTCPPSDTYQRPTRRQTHAQSVSPVNNQCQSTGNNRWTAAHLGISPVSLKAHRTTDRTQTHRTTELNVNRPTLYVTVIHSFINTHKAAEKKYKKNNKKQYIKTIHKSRKLKHAHTYH